eukprot:1482536-Pleurochrysis_carterae.AAC.1
MQHQQLALLSLPQAAACSVLSSDRYGVACLSFGARVGDDVMLGDNVMLLNAVHLKPGTPPQQMLPLPCSAWGLSVLLGGVYNKTRNRTDQRRWLLVCLHDKDGKRCVGLV